MRLITHMPLGTPSCSWCVHTHVCYIHICTYPIVRIFVMAVDSCACSRGALKRALISGTCGVRLSGVRQDGKKRKGGDKGEWQRSRCVIKAFKSAQDQLTCSNDMCWCCCCAASVQSWPLAPLHTHSMPGAIKQNEKCCCKKQSTISGTRMRSIRFKRND